MDTALPDALTPIMALPVIGALGQADGLLGLAAMRGSDVELNLSRGTLRLSTTCPALERNTFILSPDGTVPFRVNGVMLRALIDTGSRGTVLGSAAARRLSLHAPIAASTFRGIDGVARPLRYVQLQSVQAGSILRTSVEASIAELGLGPIDLLVGMDFLAPYRILLNSSQTRLSIELP